MNYNFIEKIASTNSFVKEKIDELPDWYTLRAEEQTGGRGRFGRTWFCEKGNDIAMSVLITIDKEISPFLPNLTQIVGVSVAQILDKEGVATEIKWANDVLINNRKICGILLEGVSFGENVKVAAGIGLNVNSIRKNQNEIYAISLFDETKRIFNLDDLAKEIVQNIIENVQNLRKNGLKEFIDILNDKLAYKNKQKTIINGKERITGTIFGVSEAGELLLQTESGIRKFISGEISFEK
ncbi:MAG: biotin--[acetyl-CoA-carboxylase] ligase [Chitinispirillales bacterium]|nr:biotin--[acetyl-CoA-carboxylase] ligase [Chitinispirillales bacterium]